MASRSKKKMSFERHAEVGDELRRIRGFITKLTVEIANAYPVNGKKGKAFRALRKAEWNIDQVRSELENRMYEDYPQDATTRVYYGGVDQLESTTKP